MKIDLLCVSSKYALLGLVKKNTLVNDFFPFGGFLREDHSLKVPLVFYANLPGTKTSSGKSYVGHGWIGGIDCLGRKFSQGAWPGGKIKTNEDQISLCKHTISLTVLVSPGLQTRAIEESSSPSWTFYNNCIDHVKKALDAIGYPHPSFSSPIMGISDPSLFAQWLIKENQLLDTQFLKTATHLSCID